MADPGDARQQAAGWDADSLREVRAQFVTVRQAATVQPYSDQWRAALAALTELETFVGLLLVRVQELADERDDIARTLAESYKAWFDTAERYRAERDEARANA